MNKYNNPRLLNTVVSGTGMKNPTRPHVIIGSEKNGFIRGDLMDANAVKEAVAKEVAERIDADLNLSEEIDTKVRQAVDDLVDGAPEVLDTLKELSEALGDDANFATTITEEIASKVDKVEGKGLSTNDYTTAEKQKLAGIATGAEVNVQSDWSLTNSSNDDFIKNKPTKLSQFENDVLYTNQNYIINNFETKMRVAELKQAIKEKIDNIESVLPKYDYANGHEYVDLGLPSGTLWATCNVGASSETDYGLYFQWGDTEGYTADQVGTGEGQKAFSWADYKFNPSGDGLTFIKYNETDGKIVLDLEDDAARANWRGSWKMPTEEQFRELVNRTNKEWTTINNVNGYKFTSRNDGSKYIFIPAASPVLDGQIGEGYSVWSGSRVGNGVGAAWLLDFGSDYSGVYMTGVYLGCHVRGVINPEDVNKTFVPVASKDEVLTNEKVDPNETVDIFAGSLTTDELEDLVTNTNTRKFLTTVRGNETLIVGFVDFFTDWVGHQITAVATSNIHLDEWDNESDLTLVPHTDGKANVYVAYCGLHDPAGYSGLVEGEWTRWKKFNTDTDDLNEATSSLKDREYMDSSTFDAIFTEADSDAIDWIIDNFAPTFYVKDSSDNVTTCSIVRSATAVCVARNKVDNTTYTFINECRRGTIGSSGSINWSDWTTISSTVTPAPAA